jgi:hypothetical protein
MPWKIIEAAAQITVHFFALLCNIPWDGCLNEQLNHLQLFWLP